MPSQRALDRKQARLDEMAQRAAAHAAEKAAIDAMDPIPRAVRQKRVLTQEELDAARVRREARIAAMPTREERLAEAAALRTMTPAQRKAALQAQRDKVKPRGNPRA